MNKQEEKWLSLYIFYNENADGLLKELIYPFIRQWHRPWFFIRYWEGGNHIRLRLKAAENEHEAIIKALSLDNAAVTRILTTQYEPEIDRYGNDESITWAEQYFECSSQYILNWLVKREINQSVIAQAIKLHLTLLHTLKWDDEALVELCNFFLAGWLPKLYNPADPKEKQRIFWLNQFEKVFVPVKNQTLQACSQFWQQLNSPVAELNLMEYLLKTTGVISSYQKMDFEKKKMFQVISGFMHMNNNRLGISNDEEAYIMYVIRACLQFIHENSIQQS
ncbi:thiopeptide-type bacteriocin biosynthesis protein [Pedobacter zeae]|uniref:Lantibiotic biosynthesis protein n=1 Tax=Pedobacter zeae TaxID=1737356 RepID=A0A7W6KAJ3_9SPHI|nr:thiopeptide-type bacteriocin biosynthesis protein [Pedobacter zeae]MBB4107165.1 thiopeptide-type bacteriocin biosynthesis protein [Pedobacter zeae]GGH06110.1 lantibiotic biosynthesis protein [Pedobacter zeae]